MAIAVKPIRSAADHRAAMAEVKRLWGSKNGTPDGDRLDVLATLIDAYEARHANAGIGGAQSQAHTLDWNDPQIARRTGYRRGGIDSSTPTRDRRQRAIA
jgi:hypothetical protein